MHAQDVQPAGSEQATVMAGPGEDVSKGIQSLKNFERALRHIRKSAGPLTLVSREEVQSCVSPADRAKLNLQMAYGVSSLFYMFLKTQGVSPAKHPVKAELERIRGYFDRLKRVGKPPEQRKLKVNQAASRRFINSALSGDDMWRKATTSSGSRKAQGERMASGIGRTLPAGQPPGTVGSVSSEGVSQRGKRKHPAFPPAGGDADKTSANSRGDTASPVASGKDDGRAAVAAAAAEEALSCGKRIRAQEGEPGGKGTDRYRRW